MVSSPADEEYPPTDNGMVRKHSIFSEVGQWPVCPIQTGAGPPLLADFDKMDGKDLFI